MNVWDNLNGITKGWIRATFAAGVTAGVDLAVQELTAGGLDVAALDWRQIGGAALIAGLVYARGHASGLLTYPDGSTVYVAPAPQAAPDASLPPHG